MPTNKLPRPEYPRPQFIREQWINLNGDWQFEMDHGCSGKARGLQKDDVTLNQSIVVPFCPESSLSGIGNTDFMNAVWYKRSFATPEAWSNGRTLLHFGAVDYKAEVWINEKLVGSHRGGYSSFSFDITHALKHGDNTITVYAEDHIRSGLQPRGKQSGEYHSHGCDYTRTTGIWQTVWLEYVPQTYISSFRITPDPENACIHLEAKINGAVKGLQLTCDASFEDKSMGSASVNIGSSLAKLTLSLTDVHLWQVGSPNLYDLNLSLVCDGSIIDSAISYFGLRSIHLDGMAVRINGKSVFQRLVLDQGFYPEGIYTAPSDDDLKRDIEISIGLGFNGARLHEKMFEPRFLYWADKLGYLVWGEHANWGLDISTPQGLLRFLPEWIEGVERDFNHPSLIGWCPFNETWDSGNGARQDNEVLRIVYETTKALDPTRPVIDTSGNFHVVTDIYDVHDYDQNVDTFRARYAPMAEDGEVYNTYPDRQTYGGQPYFVSEYGGIWWNPSQLDQKSWGYGDRPQSEEEFIARYAGLTTTLLDNPKMFGFCYTQLYDVEQEVNGLYTYDRTAKFDPKIIRAINTKKAAIED
ncbi:sugar-binding domain-containing protein [Paenibacillus sp. UMB4589-SE434]|uniref:glycoside hydrolase family 2 protein n=1 Tax=Paenibacillus sp. UMB4589-SE434 TaxID=3046314 RepID=UPI00254DE38D|nr:sugar-binding domain-containing protein [Paenibacillus sp. UMB4589-SE434]MDK8180335.1 glycoside hydrolase family 2 TIM barrel-domain containing protein [Paenibacillus sp. UMB4589-SE434]